MQFNQSENIFFEKVSFKTFRKGFLLETDKTAKEIYENIQLPRRLTSKSAGYDWYLPMDIKLEPNESIKIPTGIKASMDSFLSMDIYPRSGLGFKYYVRLANTTGIGDSDYYNNENNEGHYFVKIRNEGELPIKLKAGERFCQSKFVPYWITKDDNPITDERKGGLGHSGK